MNDTPLYHAIVTENLEFIKYLISKGANALSKNEYMLAFAVETGYVTPGSGNLDLAKLAVGYGCSPTYQ